MESEVTTFPAEVLIVDDTATNRAIVKYALTSSSYNTTEASNGREALDLINSKSFDLVLLDLEMPDLDGFDVTDRIREKYSRVELPIIMLTAVEVPKTIIRALERGVNDYIVKGSDNQLMLGRVNNQLSAKRAYDELEQARQEANRANLAKSTFLSNMSHELRTPLNAIIGYSELLAEVAAESEQNEFVGDLEKIQGAGKHLLELINDVLDLSKIEAGMLELYFEECDVANLINEVANTAQPLIEKNGNRLQVVKRGLGEMQVDATKLRQALLNLLSNAAKFTQNGLITLKASRAQQNGRDWLSFSVTDTGIGIGLDQLTDVFEEFKQAEISTTRNYGGTGLGLSISRKVCQLMRGDISVKSTPGKGSTFTIKLPAQQQDEDDQENDPEITEVAGDAPLVLVVDDEASARELMRHSLNRGGFRVKTAATGKTALKLAGELQPAAITLDALMPGMDGWDVLQQLKASPETDKIPVVMCTSYDGMQRGFSLGVTDYLTKPIDKKRLYLVLGGICTREECHVLVVDDDAAVRERTRMALTRTKCVVHEAENGEEALAQLDQQVPDVILLDLMMPEMNGFEFVEAVQQNDLWKKIPIVVVTSRDLTKRDHRRLNGFVESILEKGKSEPEQIVTAINRLITHAERE